MWGNTSCSELWSDFRRSISAADDPSSAITHWRGSEDLAKAVARDAPNAVSRVASFQTGVTMTMDSDTVSQ